MPELKTEQLVLIVGFILPGAISMYVYGLKVPQKEFDLKDRIAEAICFSLLNFMIVWLPIRAALTSGAAITHPIIVWLVLFLSFVIVPVAWPLILVRLLRFAEQRGWIAVRARTAWDDFFGRQKTECWLQVQLMDDSVIGGRFGSESFASSWPDPGHLFMQEVWRLDDGYFVEPLPQSAGILLRPADYKLVRVYKGVPEDQQEVTADDC